MNKCILIGNITREVEIIYTKEGVCIGSTSLAMNRYYNKDGQLQTEVCYIDLKFYGKQAETCSKFLAKGSKMGIVGRLEQNTWTDNNGNKKSKHVIVVSEVEFLGSKKDENQQQPRISTQSIVDMGSDEIPF